MRLHKDIFKLHGKSITRNNKRGTLKVYPNDKAKMGLFFCHADGCTEIENGYVHRVVTRISKEWNRINNIKQRCKDD